MVRRKNLIVTFCSLLFVVLACCGILILSTGCGEEEPVTPGEPVTVTYYIDGTDVHTEDYETGQIIGNNHYTPNGTEGLTFDGWYVDAQFKTQYDFSKVLKGNLNLYGHWIYEDFREWYIIGCGQGSLKGLDWDNPENHLSLTRDVSNCTSDMSTFVAKVELHNGDSFKVTHDNWQDTLGRSDVWVGWENFVDEDPDNNIVLKESNGPVFTDGVYTVRLFTYLRPNGSDIKNHLEITYLEALEHKEVQTFTVTITPVGYNGYFEYYFGHKLAEITQFKVKMGDTIFWDWDAYDGALSDYIRISNELGWSVKFTNKANNGEYYNDNLNSLRVWKDTQFEATFEGWQDITVFWYVDGNQEHDSVYQTGQTLTEGEIFIPDPTDHEGYVFDGWYLSDDYRENSYVGKDSIVVEGHYGEMFLYGRWLPEETTIYWYIIEDSYFLGEPNHSDTYTTLSTLTGDQIYTPDAEEHEGEVFDGWYTSPDYTAESYVGKDSIVVKPMNYDYEINLYGRWMLTIHWYVEGNQELQEKHQTGQTLTDVEIYTPDPTEHAGYVFDGWYLSKYFEKSSYVGKDSIVVEGRNGNMSLYSRWVPEQTTVTWYVDGSEERSGSYNTLSTLTGEQIYTPDTAGHDGMVFDGWYTSSIFDEYTFVGKDSILVKRNPNYGSLQLYGRWIPAQTTIQWYVDRSQAHSDSYTTLSTLTGDQIYTPDTTGHERNFFDGWYTDPNFVSSSYIGYDSIVVEYNPNGGSLQLYGRWLPAEIELEWIIFDQSESPSGAGATPYVHPAPFSTIRGSQMYTPNPKGHEGEVFDGWYAGYGIGKTNYVGKTSIVVRPNGGINTMYLSGRWLPAQTTIHWFVDGSEVHSGTYTTLSTLTGKQIYTSDPAGHEGYVFCGWYSSEDLEDYYYIGNDSIVVRGNNDDYTDMYLYARWLPVETTVHWFVDGSEVHSDLHTTLFTLTDDDIYRPDAEGHEGYVFDGWYTSPDFTADSYVGKDSIVIKGNNDSYTDMYLYARWEWAYWTA